MNINAVVRRIAAGLLSITMVAAVTYAGAAAADDVGFSVDDFAGQQMGTRTLVPGNLSCSPTGGNALTMGTGTMRVDLSVPDPNGCNYANAQVRWTAETSVNIEQNGADRIILKYRDVTPNQPSAIVFGMTLVDVNGRTASVGGLTRNGGPAGDWLTIRYTPAYVGDVAVLNFQSGFDRGNVKSVTLSIAATTNNQNVSVTFEGIGTNVGEPTYVGPSFGSAAAYEFPADTSTTHSFTVTGNPAPDVSWTNRPAWMTVTTSTTSGGRLVTMSGNPGTAYADTPIAFSAVVANSLTANATVRAVVPSDVDVDYTLNSTQVGATGPVTLGTVSSIPAASVLGTPAGLPPGTALSVSGSNVVLTGAPTTAGDYAISASLGNEFRSAPFVRVLRVGQPPELADIGTQNVLRDQSIVPITAAATGYPAPTVTFTPLPTGLSASGNIITGTPTETSSTMVIATAQNEFGTASHTFTINVGDAPSITLPASLEAVAGTAVDLTPPVTGQPTSIDATGLPDGLSVELSGGAATLSGTPTRPVAASSASGTSHITVSNAFGSSTQSLAWSVSAAPLISGPTDASTAVGSELAPVDIVVTGYPIPTLNISDPDDDGTLLPPGIGIEIDLSTTPGMVRLSGTPTAPGTERLRISATNGVGPAVSHIITVSALTAPAFADDAPTLTVRQGETGSLTLDWSGHLTPTLVLGSTLPSWVTFDATTGTFTASPTSPLDGDFGPYQVTAINASGAATAEVTITVTSSATLSSLADVTLAQGATIDQSIGAAGGVPMPTVTATGLPAGLSIERVGTDVRVNGSTGAAGGEYLVSVTAANGIGADAVTTFRVYVTTPATVSAPADAVLPVGQTASLAATLGGYPLPTVEATGLPPGLTIDDVTGVISGVPTATGTYEVTLSAVGGTAPAPQPAVMEIIVTSPPVFAPAPADREVLLGASHSTTEFTVGGYPLPEVSATGLPAGLTLVQTGSDVELEGTPTETGIFSVEVTLTSLGGTTTHTWTLTVTDPAQLTVTPSATIDVDVAMSPIPVTVTGFPAPAVTATALPDGVTTVTDGAGTRIEGTPTEYGQFVAELTATNGIGDADTATITIDVEAPPVLGSDAAVTLPASQTTVWTVPVAGYPAPALTTSALPSWLTFDPDTATFTAAPTDDDSGPAGTVTVTAVSSVGEATMDIALVVTSPPGASVEDGTTTIRTGYAVDEELTTITGYPVPTVTAEGLPDGLSVEVVGDAVRLVGSTAVVGTHAFTFTLANDAGPVLDVPWTLIVEQPATLVLPADATITLGDDVDVPIFATGYPAPTVTVTGLPDGVTWEPGPLGGRLAGSPIAAGVTTIEVSASNGVGAPAEASLTLTVDLPEITVALSATTVKAGDSIGARAEGFQPGERVTVELHSTPVRLTTVTADATGAVAITARIPADTAVGQHTVVVSGATGAEGSAPLTVTAAEVSGTGPDELSGTGADAVGPLAVALALVVAGAGLVLIVRRRLPVR